MAHSRCSAVVSPAVRAMVQRTCADAATADHALLVASRQMRAGPTRPWSLAEALDWHGSPAVWVL